VTAAKGGEVRSDAVISECGGYRYSLSRRWGSGPALRVVMLNPSTADATVDDPTIRRCIGFARREGFAALTVLNLYAYRATDPKALLTCPDPVGPDNNAWLAAHLQGSASVLAAWGANARPERVQRVLSLVRGVDWRCLGTTKQGHPRHPLYVRGDQPLVPFAPEVSS
jgi:hypothetical protein